MSSFRIMEVALRSNQGVSIEVPLGAEALAVAVKDSIPVVIYKVPSGVAGLVTSRKLHVVSAGEEISDGKYLGLFQLMQRTERGVAARMMFVFEEVKQ